MQVVPTPLQNEVYNDPYDVLKQVHGGRMGHFGARQTWLSLNRYFPGHRIPYRLVLEFVATCAVCQKDRLGMLDTIDPIVRHLRPPHPRSVVGVDTLTVTPADKDGNYLLIVVVNHFTKFTALYPAKDHSALTVATALFQYCCTYGLFDCLLSDPGSEFDNEVIRNLTLWLGIRHKFSLVDWHPSNGVESKNYQVLQRLKHLVMDERVKDRWSSPTILPLVQYMINSHVSSETGVVPFQAVFGTVDATYFCLPEGGADVHDLHTYVKLLDDNIALLKDISSRFQANIVRQRTAKTPAFQQNQYQPGDLVLFRLNPETHLPTKLTPRFDGPFIVERQYKNDVLCRHVILGTTKEFHVTRLKLFHGTLEQAKEIAMLDQDQYLIDRILAYRGNPLTRTTMSFEVRFNDGSVVWKPWDRDLSDTIQFEDFCRSRIELYPLLHDAKLAQKLVREMNASPITEVTPGDKVWVDLRSYGATWYEGLSIPDVDHIRYVVEYVYVRWVGKKNLKIEAQCKAFKEFFVVDHDFVFRYGQMRRNDVQLAGSDSQLVFVDSEFTALHPQLLR